jgi:pyruvate dehydrogenase E2 component (dihydrolipoamide acetyltransferase)
MNSVRRRTSEHMTHAWTTIPHVTQFDKADITDVERFRQQYGKRVEAAGGKLTVTAILVKLLASALKKFPQFNASIDVLAQEITYKKYYNISVAVDTDRGLLVPVVRNVDSKSVTQIAVELQEMAARAREKKNRLEEMQGATFTISNLGGVGGTSFTPIVNPPEVAILGVSRARVEPVYIDGAFQPRTMLPLSLSYDHRAIDGADAARFARWIVDALEQPLSLLLDN